jgi:hypothetical protein
MPVYAAAFERTLRAVQRAGRRSFLLPLAGHGPRGGNMATG